jgi:nucleoside-diphosphate-sugar epimerase
VYGEPRTIPIAEDDLTAPVSTYGVAKLAAETYCRAFCREEGLGCTITRLFNIYGPGQTESFVMPKFIARVMHNRPPIIYGDGRQSRSYTFISDAVRGILAAAAADEAVGEVFNIGNDQEVSLNELARFIIRFSGYDLEPIYRPFGDGIRVEDREILRRQPDIGKARRSLGFEIEVPWPEGVARFTESYLEEHRMAQPRSGHR